MCNECIDIQHDLGQTIQEARIEGESFVNQEDFDYINEFEPNIAKRFGKMWPVTCTGGVAFGCYILYRSQVDRMASMSKILLRQYQVFGVALIVMNMKSLYDWAK